MENLRKTIIEKEKLLFLVQTRQSTEELTKLLSTDFIEVGATGLSQNFASTVESLQSETNWSCETTDWEFRKLSDDIVQTIYGALIIHGSEKIGVFSKRSSIWRMERDDWKMIYHQGTRV